MGSVTLLTDGGGGTWSSSNSGEATVDASGNVTGVSSGTPIITYTLPGTGCYITTPVTVTLHCLRPYFRLYRYLCRFHGTFLSDPTGWRHLEQQQLVYCLGGPHNRSCYNCFPGCRHDYLYAGHRMHGLYIYNSKCTTITDNRANDCVPGQHHKSE